MKMRDVRDRRAFHVLHRAAGPRLDRSRHRVGARARAHRDETDALREWKHLHRQLVVDRLRPVNDREPDRLHVEKAARARGAEVAIALALGAGDVADLQGRAGMGADATHHDRRNCPREGGVTAWAALTGRCRCAGSDPRIAAKLLAQVRTRNRRGAGRRSAAIWSHGIADQSWTLRIGRVADLSAHRGPAKGNCRLPFRIADRLIARMHLRRSSTSLGISSLLTISSQLSGRGIGHSASGIRSRLLRTEKRLDHSQFSARSTSPFLSALRST